jgi:hypothetical protein
MVVPQEVIATQQGIATVLHGFGAPLLEGNSWWELACFSIATPDGEVTLRE